MGINQLLQRNRQQINHDLTDPEQRKLFSPSAFAVHETVVPLILQYARGKVIDVGCGDMPFRSFIERVADQYDTIDVERRVPEVKYVGDIMNMSVLPDATYDTAVCFEVLEHVRDPFRGLEEIARILKPGGRLIMSVPHMTRLHEEPHDYFRFTKYGISECAIRAGLEVELVKAGGGLFSMVGHQVSTVLLGATWHIPVVRQVSFTANAWLSSRLCYYLDHAIDKQGLLALGYTIVARKRGGEAAK